MMEVVNGKDDIPYMKWKINNVSNHQPVLQIAKHVLRQVPGGPTRDCRGEADGVPQHLPETNVGV